MNAYSGMKKMKCVVLAGGGGIRLWPLSRQNYPKQFLALKANRTIFEETILRNRTFTDKFMIITNDEYKFIVEKQMEIVNIRNYEMILETIGRNTAPAITLACMKSKNDDLLFVVPADAKIVDGREYQSAVAHAQELAKSGYIVTFGIKPNKPHTGYGYIKYVGNDVIEFKEKPSTEVAEKYIADGNYLWNSGMFLFRIDVFLSEIRKYRPDIYNSCKELTEIVRSKDAVVINREMMEKIPSESIDYAVMENSDRIKVIPSYFEWNDIGSIESFYDEMDKNINQNVIYSNCVHTGIINNVENQLVVANSLQDVIIVNTIDAVYVSKIGKSSEIKNIAEKHYNRYGKFFKENNISFRPWGFCEVLTDNEIYKVKRIIIHPNKRLSLHKHELKSEHCIIVAGNPVIKLGDSISKYTANQSVYVPKGTFHQIINETDDDIEIIEISIGKSISEDDIIQAEEI